MLNTLNEAIRSFHPSVVCVCVLVLDLNRASCRQCKCSHSLTFNHFPFQKKVSHHRTSLVFHTRSSHSLQHDFFCKHTTTAYCLLCTLKTVNDSNLSKRNNRKHFLFLLLLIQHRFADSSVSFACRFVLSQLACKKRHCCASLTIFNVYY